MSPSTSPRTFGRSLLLILAFALLFPAVIPRPVGAFGTITFAPPITLGTAGPTGPLLVADLDGDGRQDLVAITNGGTWVTIWYGRGMGAFDAPMVYPGNAEKATALDLLSPDLNRDQKPDLVFFTLNGTVATVLINQGARRFATPLRVPIDSTTTALAPGDVNEDGWTDLVTVNSNGGLGAYLNNQDGTFHRIGAASRTAPSSPVPGDFNRDGHLDIAYTTLNFKHEEYGVAAALGNGSGGFIPGTIAEPWGKMLLTDDFDRDGLADLVVLGATGYKAFLRGNGAGDFVDGSPSFSLFTASQARSADLDGDGYPELIETGYQATGMLYFFRNQGDGNFAEEVAVGALGTTLNGTGHGSSGDFNPDATAFVSIGDFNEDGRPDLAATDSATNQVRMWLNTTASLPAPQNLRVVAAVPGEIDLAWDRAGNATTDFEVQRRILDSTGNVIFDRLGVVVGTTYADRTMKAGVTYEYRVRAVTSTNGSGYSHVVRARTPELHPPAAPTNLTATSSTSNFGKLTWDDISSNEQGFQLEQQIGAGTFAELARIGANVEEYSLTGLSPETHYTFRLRAYNDDGYSPFSPPVELTSLAVPGEATAQAVGSYRVTVSWTDRSANETAYVVMFGFSEWGRTPANSTHFTGNVVTNSTFQFYVRAISAQSESDYAIPNSVQTLAAPTGLRGHGEVAAGNRLTWTDRSNSEERFEIERRTASSAPYEFLASSEPQTQQFDDATALPGVTYQYRVRAARVNSVSDYSYEISATRPYQPLLASLTLKKSTLKKGKATRATVRLTHPALPDGALVTLSTGKQVIKMPANILIPAGSISGDFVVSARSVSRRVTTTLIARYAASARSAKLHVEPR